MQARFRGTCSKCTTSIEVGDEIEILGPVPNSFRKIVAHRFHSTRTVQDACGDVADGMAHLILDLSDDFVDGPKGNEIAHGLVAAAGTMLASFDPSYGQSFDRQWGEYSSEYEYFDGEPRAMMYGLLDMLMISAGRKLRRDGTVVGTVAA